LELSSLRRAESHVLAMVDTILEVLHRLTGNSAPLPPQEAQVVPFDSGERLLAEDTDDLLGHESPVRGVRIMVTIPGEAAHDYTQGTSPSSGFTPDLMRMSGPRPSGD